MVKASAAVIAIIIVVVNLIFINSITCNNSFDSTLNSYNNIYFNGFYPKRATNNNDESTKRIKVSDDDSSCCLPPKFTLTANYNILRYSFSNSSSSSTVKFNDSDDDQFADLHERLEVTHYYSFKQRKLRQQIFNKSTQKQQQDTLVVQRINATTGFTDYVFFFMSNSSSTNTEEDNNTINCRCFVTAMDPFPEDKYCVDGADKKPPTGSKTIGILPTDYLNINLYEMHSQNNVTHIATENSLWMHRFNSDEVTVVPTCWPVMWQVKERYEHNGVIAMNRAAITIFNVNEVIENEKQLFTIPSFCPSLDQC